MKVKQNTMVYNATLLEKTVLVSKNIDKWDYEKYCSVGWKTELLKCQQGGETKLQL